MSAPHHWQETCAGWDPAWTALEHDMLELYSMTVPANIHQFWHRCYFEDLWTFMGEKAAGCRYIELGSGRGTTAMYLAARGCSVTMVDLSSTAFHIASINFEHHGIPLPVMVQADARQTGLPDQSFDCVYSIGLLEHFNDPVPVLQESLRLLAPGGGQFAVIIPDRPPSAKLLAEALFCPWRLAAFVTPRFLKRRLRGKASSASKPAVDAVTRTGTTGAEYAEILLDLGAADVSFVPYNAYQSVLGSLTTEGRLVVPFYRAHHAIRKRLTQPPYCRTWAGIAACDLLTFRKPL